MGLVRLIPEVDTFCFYLKLKWGVMIIIFGFGFLCVFLGWIPKLYFSCSVKNNKAQDLAHLLSYGYIGGNVVLGIAWFLFLMGFIYHKGETATLFIYAVCVLIMTYLLFTLVSIFGIIANTKCPLPYVHVIFLQLFLIVWIYITIVVKSYQYQEMMYYN